LSEEIQTECEECRRDKNRSLLDKIDTRFQKGFEFCKWLKNGTRKYGRKFFTQALLYETWANEGKTCVKNMKTWYAQTKNMQFSSLIGERKKNWIKTFTFMEAV